MFTSVFIILLAPVFIIVGFYIYATYQFHHPEIPYNDTGAVMVMGIVYFIFYIIIEIGIGVLVWKLTGIKKKVEKNG